MESNRKLYLRESKARRNYRCAICSSLIAPGNTYYRDEPFPMARLRGEAGIRKLCFSCVTKISFVGQAVTTYRTHTKSHTQIVVSPITDGNQLILPFSEEVVIHQTHVRLINVTELLIERILNDYSEIYRIGSENFEYLVQDRLCAMGMETERIGHTFGKDGGVDIVFWPRPPFPMPFLGAVQLKHHRSPNIKTGPAAIREIAGVLHTQPFNFGIVVTNTSFTPDAKWFAEQERALIRLRDMNHLKRWIASNFTDDAEWREIPTVLELCPGVTVDLKKKMFRQLQNV